MKPTEIKDVLVKKLRTLTIDDIFADPDRIELHTIFQELTGTNNPDEIDRYLCDQIENWNKDIFAITSIEDLKGIKRNRRECEAGILSLNKEVDDTKISIEETQRIIHDKTETKDNLCRKIEIIDNDISLLNNTPGISTYKEQITTYENNKQKLNRTVVDINNEIIQYNLKADSLKKELQEKLEQISIINININEFEEEIKLYESRKVELEQLDKASVIIELEAIDFISILLLGKNYVDLQTSLVGYISYKQKSDSNFFNFDPIYPENLQDMRFYYQLDNIKHQNCEPPSKWQKILHDTFSHKVLTYSGILFSDAISVNLNGYDNLRERIGNNYKILKNLLSVYTDPVPFNSMELSYIISLKQSLKLKSPCIRTSNNGILMQLSGGLSAEIYFREKGKTISEFAKKNGSMYRNMLLSNQYKVALILYSQSIYDLTIDAPCGFYVIAEYHVIEIFFRATPVLLDSPNLGRFMQLAAKVEANKIEQEANNDNDNNDYYEDDWDYDN